MAEDNVNEQEQGQAKKGPGKFGTIIIVVMLVAIGIGLISDDDKPQQSADSTTQFDPDQARLEEQQQRERRQELANQGSGSGIDDGELDPFAAMSAMTRRQEMLEQKLADANSRLEDAEGSAEDLAVLRENQERLEGQISQLTQMLKDEAETQRSQDRRDAAALNDEGGDLAFDLEGGLSGSDLGSEDGERVAPTRPKKVSPFGENYIVLGNRNRNPVLSQNDPFAPTAATTARGEGLFDPEDGLEAPNPFGGSAGGNQTAQSGGQVRASTGRQSGMTPEYGSVSAGYTGESQDAVADATASVETEDDGSDSQVPVPAFSFVEAETLHGLDCPIGADLPRNSTGNGGGVTPGMAQPMPVVLPLRGKIRGPNGNVANLGTAHVMGWCIGKRVDRGEAGRAYIKVESISYWDRKGDPQYLNTISGDVISLLDNHRGIQAPVDEVRRSYLGEQAGAAALAAAATQLTQAQFTETRNPEGGVDRVFDGDRATALAGQGGAAAMNQVAALLNEEASMAYDVVRVPSGAPVRILFMAPFEVTNLKLEVEDEILDAYDILI